MRNNIFLFLLLSLFVTSCSGTKVMEHYVKKNKKKLSLIDKKFTTSDGYEIAYSDNELADKPTLFFVHHYLLERSSFFGIAKKFNNKDYRLVLIDLPAFGESSNFPDGDYKVSSQAKRLNELINHLELKNVHLVGTSMGGAISIVLNTLNTNVKTSTLISPLGMPLYVNEPSEIIRNYIETGQIPFLIEEPYNENRTKDLFSFTTNTPKFLLPKSILNASKISLMKGRASMNKAGKDILYDKNSIIKLLQENPEYKKFDVITNGFGISLESFIKEIDDITPVLNLVNKNKNIEKSDEIGQSYEDLTPKLEKIETPILLIWGKKDRIIHYKTMETMMRYIKTGKFKLIKNGSHFISIQKAGKISRYMKDFLN